MNPYEILGVPPSAGKQEISAAFRKKAKDCHPDLYPSDKSAEVRFIQLKKAYEEAVANFVGLQAARPPRPNRATRTIRREVTLSVPEVVRGTTVRMPGSSGPCLGCGGEGHLRSNHAVACGTCGGSGISGYREKGIIRVKVACPDCAGSGRTTRITCVECGGYGSAPSVALDVDVPPGCRDGDVLSVPGGSSDPERGIAGDLEIVVRVKEGDGWRIVRDDIEKDVEIPVWDAVLGTELAVEGPDGRRFKLTVPPGSQSGRRFRLKGQGYAGGGTRGDFVAVLGIAVPNPADPDVRRAFERLRDDIA